MVAIEILLDFNQDAAKERVERLEARVKELEMRGDEEPKHGGVRVGKKDWCQRCGFQVVRRNNALVHFLSGEAECPNRAMNIPRPSGAGG